MSESSSVDGTSVHYDLFQILNADTSKQVYLLVDPAFYDDFWPFWSSFQPKARQLWCDLFQNGPYDALASMSPLIIKIEEGGAGETLYYWLVKQSELFNKACLLIESRLSLNELRDFWQQRISAIYPNEQCDLLVSYSPPLLKLFWLSLSANEQALFLAEDTDIYLPAALFLQDMQDSAAIKPPSANCFSRLTCHPLDALQAATDNGFSIEAPYKLNDSQYELLSRNQRRYRMVNDIFLRLSQYFTFVLDIDHISSLFYSSIEMAKANYPNESEFALETFAVYRFVLENDYYQNAEFKALQSTYDLRTSIQIFSQQQPSLFDDRFQSKQALWLTSEEQGSNT